MYISDIPGRASGTNAPSSRLGLVPCHRPPTPTAFPAPPRAFHPEEFFNAGSFLTLWKTCKGLRSSEIHGFIEWTWCDILGPLEILQRVGRRAASLGLSKGESAAAHWLGIVVGTQDGILGAMRSRIEQAQEQAQENTMSMFRIAAGGKYVEGTSCNIWFSRWSGMSPITWRKRKKPYWMFIMHQV